MNIINYNETILKTLNFQSTWDTWAIVLFWLGIIAISIVLIIFALKFILKFSFALFTKIVIPIILVFIFIVFMFFVVIAFADTYFDAGWWDSLTGSTKILNQNLLLLI